MISLFNLKCFFCNLIVLQCIYITTILKTFKCGSEQKILTVEELRRNVLSKNVFSLSWLPFVYTYMHIAYIYVYIYIIYIIYIYIYI